jgi:hypothetical protein
MKSLLNDQRASLRAGEDQHKSRVIGCIADPAKRGAEIHDPAISLLHESH